MFVPKTESKKCGGKFDMFVVWHDTNRAPLPCSAGRWYQMAENQFRKNSENARKKTPEFTEYSVNQG
jgi:hypothetical protein